MEVILDDIRKDAIRKLKLSIEEDRKPLIDAAVMMMELNAVAIREGLLSLDPTVVEEEGWFVMDSYLKRVILLIVDGVCEQGVVEVGAGEYWKQNPQGIMAMVCYIYLCGTICIQQGKSHNVMRRILKTLLPEECYLAFDTALEEGMTDIMEKMGPRNTEDEEEIKAREEKKLLRKKTAEQFFDFQPMIKSPELREAITALEEEILVKLSDSALKKVLRGYDNFYYRHCYHSRRDCLYGLCNKARQKILDECFTYSKNEVMRKIIDMGEQPEEKILGSVLMMYGEIERLRCLGEI